MYPEDKKDLKPSPIIRSAIETLNTFINEEGINLSYARTGAFDMANKLRGHRCRPRWPTGSPSWNPSRPKRW